uniref:Neur_chan_memb domain-containing protein n=1 Tax=Steinernema glaseri TaxID=37863 RepID=A0A1I7YGX7_9BILA
MNFLISLFCVAYVEAHMEFTFVNITETREVFNDSFLSGIFLLLAVLSVIIIFIIICDIVHMLHLELLPKAPRKPPRRKTTRIEVARSTIV